MLPYTLQKQTGILQVPHRLTTNRRVVLPESLWHALIKISSLKVCVASGGLSIKVKAVDRRGVC